MRYSAWNPHGRGLPPWQLALVLVLGISLAIAIAVVATGVFLIALPVAAIAALGYRLFGARRRRGPAHHVIEGEYEVVEPARPRPRRESGPR